MAPSWGGPRSLFWLGLGSDTYWKGNERKWKGAKEEEREPKNGKSDGTTSQEAAACLAGATAARTLRFY